MRKLFRRNQKGFTLVELVVVIAILGILAAIAVPRFVNAIDEANVATDAANVKVLQAAVNMYFMEHNEYPANLGILVDETHPENSYIDAVPTELTPVEGATFGYTAETGVVTEAVEAE